MAKYSYKMGDTIIHIAARQTAREFRITCGAIPGYEGNHPAHSIEHVIAAHHEWQRIRETIQGVVIAPCIISYGWTHPRDGVQSAYEPGFTISGTINPLYDADLTDGEGFRRILDLAEFLRTALGQTRVYFTYLDDDTIIEAPDAQLPTDE